MSREKYSDISLKIDRLRIEMAEFGKTMGSISPKLSIYLEYRKKMDKLNQEYAELVNQRMTNQPKP